MVDFCGVAEGVKLFASTEAISAFPFGLKAVLTRADGKGSGAFEGLKSCGHIGTSNGNFAGLTALKTEGATARGVWELEGGTADIQQELSLGFVIAYNFDPANGLPTRGQTSISVSLASASHVPTASSTAPIPRFGSGLPLFDAFAIG